MKQNILNIINIIAFPIKKEFVLFVFLYLLGSISINLIQDKPYLPFYLKLYGELFFDTYIVCLLASKAPKILHTIILIIIYFTAYILAVIDTFCFIKLGSFISPSIVQLILETNSNEVSGFFSTYIDENIILSPVGFILLLLFINILLYIFINTGKYRLIFLRRPYFDFIISILLFTGIYCSLRNKEYIVNLYRLKTISEIENYMGQDNWAKRSLYLPFHRFCYALYTNKVSQDQMIQCAKNAENIIIKKNEATIPNIILIIGESYNKYHSNIYGYAKPTTPFQKMFVDNGDIIIYKNIVSPFNLTSDVFKNMFSLNDLNKNEDWDESPLFTQIFKKAGYHVTFFTNQYVKAANEYFFQFSGSVFLNNPNISKSQFDCRNTQMYTFDEELIDSYRSISKSTRHHDKLIIFHLIGQHADYKDRYPEGFKLFKPSDYNRPGLSNEDKKIIADYDNATLYNDYIVKKIIDEFTEQDAIVIYFSDHGEECFDNNMGFGRSHGEITRNIAKYEFEIPFWIYTTKMFRKRHTEIYNQIVSSQNKPGTTDDLGHMLIYLGGISCPDYDEKNNILSPCYNTTKRRLLRNNVDYDKLMSTK